MGNPEKTEVVARREHKCTFCRFPIPVGETYHYQRLGPPHHPDNEGWFTVKAHLDCWAAWNLMGNDYDWIFPEDQLEFLFSAQSYGFVQDCGTCLASGSVDETTGDPVRCRGGYTRAPGESVCPSCGGRGIRIERPRKPS